MSPRSKQTFRYFPQLRHANSMVVSVVSVWKVWMRVNQRLVPVLMTMFDAVHHRIVMLMQVMFVVKMFMTVFHLFMLVPVLMAFS